jgi:hypothetical protein
MSLKPSYTVPEFLRDFAVGRTRFYQLVNAGAIKARKNGSRTVVLGVDAEAWLKSLPDFGSKKAA